MRASLRILTDFDGPSDLGAWRSVDDVVMGGVSRSRIEPAGPSLARFTGVVSLEHGGGFASVRTEPRAWPTAGATAFVLHCRADGRTYKFTLRTDDGFDGVQYQARFTPADGTWETVTLPVDVFVASFRGRPVPGSPPLDPARVRRIGLMISERQAGPFALEIDWIAACGD